MQFAGGSFVPLFLVLLTYAISSSGDSGKPDCRQQRNKSDLLLPAAAAAALRPPRTQSLYTFDGTSNVQNSTPASGYPRPPSNNNDDGPSPNTPFPFPAFIIVGLLALFWVWIMDEAMILQFRLRLRSGTLGRAAGVREKSGCRCRVCTLRMQARGQPLHDVSENVA